jgi:medium-chain acyl-[acyl-carrier-protein] hydrolase
MPMGLHSDSWIKCPHPKACAHLRLFCFPYAGGGASIFRAWSNDLPVDVEVCPIQLPGHENRVSTVPFTRLEPLVEALEQVLLPYLDIPFVFFGHSMGALVSFELARQLRRQGRLAPFHLFVSGCRAPQIPAVNASIHQLPKDEFLEKLRHLNGTPMVILQNAELMQLLLPVIRADFSIVETYVYSDESPLNCSISAFGGVQDRVVSYAHLAAWCEQTGGSFTLQLFPGNHFFLQSARSLLLQALSQDLTQLLSQLSRGEGS